MKARLLILTLLVCSLNVQGQRVARRAGPMISPPASVSGQTLPIRRVILYSNGVAYIERRGTVTGHAEVDLSFKQSQVDDVLKSMVVLDLGQGRIGAVSYNSSAPPSARLTEIPFSIAAQTGNNDNGGLAGVLAQLQGAHVIVTTATKGAVAGSVLTIETHNSQTDGDKPAIVSHSLVITTEADELASFDLAEVRSVKLVDEGTRRDVNEFATASASARRRDAKTITVTSDGSGSREMVVSYTVAAPIWKTTYRVVLDTEGKPFFQGWAIVDNVSDEDWNNVELSLVSGTPVSFIQPIQQPFYRYRPVVPIPGDLNLEPQVYESMAGGSDGSLSGTVTDTNGAVIPDARVTVTNSESNKITELTTDDEGNFNISSLPIGTYKITAVSSGFAQTTLADVAVLGGRSANVDLTLSAAGASATVTVSAGDSVRYGNKGTGRNRSSVNGLRTVQGLYAIAPTESDAVSRNVSPDVSAALTTGNSGVDTAASGSELGDLFEYHIDQPITVHRDRSALIPIVQTKMEGERISVYNAATRADRAMGGLLLKNTSALTMEGGSMTVLDGNAYAGEALMERLKPAEERLISYALDLGTLVTTKQNADRAPVYRIRAVNGVFQTFYHQTEQMTYTFKNQTDKPRVIYVEHPIRAAWELDQSSPKPAFTTGHFYRFRLELPPFEKRELIVTERRPLQETYQISNVTRDLIDLFVAQRYIDDATRAALEHLLDLRARIAALESQVSAADKEIAEIAEDQARLRENIKALTATAEAKTLITRYVAKADTQESRIEELDKQRQVAKADQAKLQAELEAAVREFDITRDL